MIWVAARWGEREPRWRRPHSPLCPRPGSWRRRGSFHAPGPGRVRSPSPEAVALWARPSPHPRGRHGTPRSPETAGAGRAGSRRAGSQRGRLPALGPRRAGGRAGGQAAAGPTEQSPHGHLETVNRPPAQATPAPAHCGNQPGAALTVLEVHGGGLRGAGLRCGRQRASANRVSTRPIRTTESGAYRPGSRRSQRDWGVGPAGAASRRSAACDWLTRTRGRTLEWGREAGPLSRSQVPTVL